MENVNFFDFNVNMSCTTEHTHHIDIGTGRQANTVKTYNEQCGSLENY